MFLLKPKTLRVGLILLATFLVAFEQPSGVSAAEVPVGTLQNCAHEVKGEVVAINKKEIMIKGFGVEPGPGTWFHAQLKGQEYISNNPGTFDTIPYPGPTDCGRIATKVEPADIKLALPKDITEYVSIGLFCHVGCANFGSVKIGDLAGLEDPPATFTAPAACTALDTGTPDTPVVPGCPSPKNNVLGPVCETKEVGAGGGSETATGNSTAADAAGSVGCIAGGVIAVTLLNARN